MSIVIFWFLKLLQPSSDAQGAIVASMPAGSFVGALLVTQLADRLGRKPTVILAGMIWVIGSILQCASVVRVVTFRFIRLTLSFQSEPRYARCWSHHLWYLCWLVQCRCSYISIRGHRS